MKKIFTAACVALLSLAATAQEAKQETEYRRSSLYTIMIPDEGLGEAKELVTGTFDTIPIPDKFNDHNLAVRSIDLSAITVTPEEVKAVSGSGKGMKKMLGGLLKGAGKAAASAATGGAVSTQVNNDDEVVAKLLKYFKENHVGNQLVAKWYNRSAEPVDGAYFNYNLIADRGLYSASQEELAAAKQTRGGEVKIMDAAAADLIPRTFVMATRYNYLSAEEVIAMVTQGLGGAAGGAIGGATALAGQALAKVLHGYFVTTSTYLFRLDWTPELQAEFESKYMTATDLTAFDLSDAYQLKYVGKTKDFAPATLKLTVKGDAAERLIKRATVRATDASIAKLQRKHDEFKTLATLHIDGDRLYAYIGKKEGVKSGDKYEVLEQRLNEDGTIEMKRVGTIKVAKDKVWDNRFGAGENIEGAASGQEDSDTDPSLTYTLFDGNAKKLMEGMLIRQIK